uniref:Platelet-derived growth factor (PDGF) family profile domain-containing protein n=1 Tax=Romanomermis culicivorax TaxID=13658 RepID=A0A915LAG3_ROMCU
SITDDFYQRWRKISTVEEAYELLNLTYDAKWERKFFSPEGGLVINNPVQSRKESCLLTTVCSPLPIQRQPNHVYFPYCIDLEQCSGFCCDYGNQCVPENRQVLKIRVKDWLITNTGKSTAQPDLVVEVQKHTGKCRCKLPDYSDFNFFTTVNHDQWTDENYTSRGRRTGDDCSKPTVLATVIGYRGTGDDYIIKRSLFSTTVICDRYTGFNNYC